MNLNPHPEGYQYSSNMLFYPKLLTLGKRTVFQNKFEINLNVTQCGMVNKIIFSSNYLLRSYSFMFTTLKSAGKDCGDEGFSSLKYDLQE